MFLLRLAARNVVIRPTRSLLTVLGVAVGVGAVVALVAIAEGFVLSFSALLRARGVDLTVTRRGVADLILSSLPQDFGAELAAVPGVARVSGILVDVGTVDDRPSTPILGMQPGEFVGEHLRVLRGRRPRGDGAAKEVMIGKALAEYLRKDVGSHVDLEADVFDVVGVFDGGNLWEDGGVVLPRASLQKLMDRPGVVTLFQIRVVPGVSPDDVKRRVVGLRGGIQALVEREALDANQGLRLAQTLAWATSLIAMAVGAIGTMNTMMMSVFERTREIGLLRALGWRRRRVTRLILCEALVLAIAGGVAGMGLGVLGVQVVARLPMAEGLVQGDFGPGLFARALALALVLGLGGGVLPALRASRLRPAEALRHE